MKCSYEHARLQAEKLVEFGTGSKYGQIQTPIVPGICSGGYSFEGELRVFIEDNPISIASGVFRDMEQLSELKLLAAAGRKELAAAKKASTMAPA